MFFVSVFPDLDKPDESFEKNGILTMNIYTFSRILSNDTCSVS